MDNNNMTARAACIARAYQKHPRSPQGRFKELCTAFHELNLKPLFAAWWHPNTVPRTILKIAYRAVTLEHPVKIGEPCDLPWPKVGVITEEEQGLFYVCTAGTTWMRYDFRDYDPDNIRQLPTTAATTAAKE